MQQIALILMLSVVLIAGGKTTVAAQNSSCTVEPRTEAEVDALVAAATPAASPTPADAMPMPKGDEVDQATLEAIHDTLAQIVACTDSGDLYRLLALYSDRYVATVAMAPEPIQIEQGSATPDGQFAPKTPVAGTPVPNEMPVIEQAVLLADGRVAALVTTRATGQQIAFFVFEADRWRLDETAPYAAPATATLEGGQAAAIDAAVAQAASDAGVAGGEVTVVEVRAETFPDTALGCPVEGGVYAQVLTPGYVVLLEINGTQLEFHTDADGRSVVACPVGS